MDERAVACLAEMITMTLHQIDAFPARSFDNTPDEHIAAICALMRQFPDLRNYDCILIAAVKLPMFMPIVRLCAVDIVQSRALFHAISCRNRPAVDHLAGLGVDVRHVMPTVAYFDVEMVVHLLALGADPTCADDLGNTLLHECTYTTSASSLRIIAELVAHGADVNQPNHNGETPLGVAQQIRSDEHRAAVLAALATPRKTE